MTSFIFRGVIFAMSVSPASVGRQVRAVNCQSFRLDSLTSFAMRGSVMYIIKESNNVAPYRMQYYL